LSSEKAGIRGDFARLAGPKSLTPYRSGMLYFHGGASLQECVLPVITLRLEQEQPVLQQPAISIRYKNGAKRITTRLPVITLQAQGDLFSAESDFEILLEAHDRKNNVVGEAKAGGIVDPATGTISIKPGHPLQITLKMQLEFEGKFKVKALNPSTLTAYDQIDLETDYTV
jgi:hypothetical protein